MDRTRKSPAAGTSTVGVLALSLVVILMSSRVRADYLNGIGNNLVPPFSTITTVFPNWVLVPAGAFYIYIQDDVFGLGWCENEHIVGVTVFNYGGVSGVTRADGVTDITGMYFQIKCGGTDSGLQTMTFLGDVTVGPEVYPAWTWAGDIVFGKDPATSACCLAACAKADGAQWGAIEFYVYADIGPCPVDGHVIQVGPGFNDLTNPGCPGGVYGNDPTYPGWCGDCGNWGPISDTTIKTIRYIMKEVDRETAAPGDTVNYTIYYGRPGAGIINNYYIMDTKPAYMHIRSPCSWSATRFSASPVLDPGPPERLWWTIPGPINPAGGATAAVAFCATVDWGANSIVYPEAGTTGAPEGAFLTNNAHLSWDPDASCTSGRLSNTKSTVVKRYLFWKIGDQDILLAPRIGLPDDEIIYDIFLKNLSQTMTWWNVRVWDTVPAEIDTWFPGFGVYDPCVGWTMTPTGCAPGSPAKMLTGAKNENTLIYWSLDMGPGETLSVRFKGRLYPWVVEDISVINRASVRAYGIPTSIPMINATGDAQADRRFTHQALVKLRTTYVSYVGWAGDDTAWFKGCVDQMYFISFYPLNKAANFQLYKKWCCAGDAAPCAAGCAAFAVDGGVSPKIDEPAGTCTGGPPIDWEMGCGQERSPARYMPNEYAIGYNKSPSNPFNYLHKMLSNAPMVWELSMCLADRNQDANTYCGTSSLTFNGYIAYTFLRVDVRADLTIERPTVTDGIHIVNTDDTTPTTVFVFGWDAPSKTWSFKTTKDIYNGSQWAYVAPNPPFGHPGHHRVISSDTPLIVHKGWIGIGQSGSYNDFGTLAPNRENGGLVSSPGVFPTTFYLFAGNMPYSDVVVVGHVLDGGPQANYTIYKYVPWDPAAANPSPSNISIDLVGFAGDWVEEFSGSVDGIFATNPHGVSPWNSLVYGTNYQNVGFSPRFALYKVVLTSGGPIQVYCGRGIVDEYSGGSMLHTAEQLEPGGQTGNVYWWHTYRAAHAHSGHSAMAVDVFCPKVNLRLNMRSSDGASATYTTNDIDECVAFRGLTMPGAPDLRNWKIEVQDEANSGCVTSANCNPGRVITQYIACNFGEKFYTAPFLSQGIFYDILTPPAVFTGQDFWITIVVKMMGDTVTDYCSTSQFTSTDPDGEIEGGPLGSFTYVWSSQPGACGSSPFDDGVHIFVRVNFSKLGLQTIVANDIYDGSITGLATFMVVGADIKLFKTPKLAVVASGDNLDFRVCWSNYSTASGLNVVITDAIPVGTTYVPGAASNALCSWTPGKAPSLQMSYSTSTSATPPATFTTISGGTSPPAGTRWLRWTLNMVSIYSTGCACYTVKID